MRPFDEFLEMLELGASGDMAGLFAFCKEHCPTDDTDDDDDDFNFDY